MNPCFSLFSPPLFPSPFLGDSYIWYRPSFIIWALHLLIIQTPTWAPVPSDTLTSSLWVVVTKVTLFRGLLFINAARKVVVVHLMWWWQPLLGYFEPSFFLCVGSEGYNNWDASLIWTLKCPRRNYSSNVFSSPQLVWAGIMGHDVSSDGPKAQPTRYSGPVPTIIISKKYGPPHKGIISIKHNQNNRIIFWKR